MAEFIVTDPRTGRKLRLTGDSPPTEAELEAIFAQQGEPVAASERQRTQLTQEQKTAEIDALKAEQAAFETGGPSVLGAIKEVGAETLSTLRGLPETALQLATGGFASAAGGAAAIPVTIAEAIRGGDDPSGAGRAVIEEFQERFTFQPRTEPGQRASEAIAAPLEAFDQFAADIGEAAGDPEDVLGATMVKTAILGAPALFGLRRGPTITRPAPKPTPRQQVATQAATEGYVTPPSVRGDAGVAGLAEGLGGKIKTGQQAIETNQVVTNKLASRAVGLPDDVPVTIDVLQAIRQEAGQAYDSVRGVGQVFTDVTFRRDLSAATSRFRSAAKDFPELAKSEIIDVVDSLRLSEFNAGAGVDAISLLRNRADVAFRGGDKSLGNAYRSASNAVEGVIERHISRGGDSALIDGFRQARQQIAETYSVQEALQGRITGEVSATQLAAQLKKGKPLSGDLRTIADFANTFPSVSRLFTGTAQAFSPLDLAVGGSSVGIAGTAAALGAGPAALVPLAGTIARPLLRRGALSEVARRSGLGRDLIRPSTAVRRGGALSAVLASQEDEQ